MHSFHGGLNNGLVFIYFLSLCLCEAKVLATMQRVDLALMTDG